MLLILVKIMFLVCHHVLSWIHGSIETPPNIYLFKVKNRNTRKKREICSKLTIKIIERLLLFLNILHTHLLLLNLNK